jgi:hypothetical protein
MSFEMPCISLLGAERRAAAYSEVKVVRIHFLGVGLPVGLIVALRPNTRKKDDHVT